MRIDRESLSQQQTEHFGSLAVIVWKNKHDSESQTANRTNQKSYLIVDLSKSQI